MRMLSMRAIVTSLLARAASALPSGVPLAWPGLQLATESLAEWVEAWCDAVNGLTQRSHPPEQREIWLTLHAFARPTNDTTRVHEISESLRAAFGAQTIPVIDSSASPATQIGSVRMREADVRDLTHLHAEDQRRPLHHLVVIVRGTVQAA
jgi:hypothetical protein